MEGLIPVTSRMYSRVPLERLGVLIGEDGKVKRELELRTRTRISIDSRDGTVIIEPEHPDVPPINLLKAKDFIAAISYGFNPERAFRLLDHDQTLIVIDLKEYLGDKPNHIQRVKGRIIGEKGKTRRVIEESTGVYMSIHDHYIAIIGDYEQANVAREAVEMLIRGRQHSTVYRFLEREMRKIKRAKAFDLWERTF